VIGERAAGVDRPLRATPDRRPRSARRTSHLDVAVGGGGLVVEGGARDVVTGTGGDGRVVAEATLRAVLGAGNVLVELETEPVLPGSGRLVGATVGAGFRSAAREVAARRWPEPVGLLLDDLPVGVLVSGYGALRSGALVSGGAAGDAQLARMRDLCAGWASGGVMIASLEQGAGVPVPGLGGAPRLERPDDPLALEAMRTLPDGSLRRRRRLDVVVGEPAIVDAMFRDTHAADGVEGTLHEYGLTATVDGSGRLRSVTADPRVLPWPECPAAAAGVVALVGVPTDELGGEVRARLRGTGSCTHLNDLLRSLAAVGRLARLGG